MRGRGPRGGEPTLGWLVHNMLDKLWLQATPKPNGKYFNKRFNKHAQKARFAARTKCYLYLAHHMGIAREDCHVSKFSEEQKAQAYELLKGVTISDVRRWHDENKLVVRDLLRQDQWPA